MCIRDRAQPVSFGALTVRIETDFDGCMKLVQQLTEKHNIYLLNSMNSVRIEWQKAIGIETLHQLMWQVPVWFLIPVGNAGNITAYWKGYQEYYSLKKVKNKPKMMGVQAEGSAPIVKGKIIKKVKPKVLNSELYPPSSATIPAKNRKQAPVILTKKVKAA